MNDNDAKALPMIGALNAGLWGIAVSSFFKGAAIFVTTLLVIIIVDILSRR